MNSICRQHAPPPCTVQTYNALKGRFSAAVGEEPKVELVLVYRRYLMRYLGKYVASVFGDSH